MGSEVYLPVIDTQFLSDVVPVKFDGLADKFKIEAISLVWLSISFISLYARLRSVSV